MPETMYRASRLFRVLGNPTAYLILRCLGSGRKTPEEMSAELGIHPTTISGTLRNLRQVDLVRYLTSGKHKIYWLKETAVGKLLDRAESLVDTMRAKRK
jgi:DNA-binding transcriptional ArsR family regulator